MYSFGLFQIVTRQRYIIFFCHYFIAVNVIGVEVVEFKIAVTTMEGPRGYDTTLTIQRKNEASFSRFIYVVRYVSPLSKCPSPVMNCDCHSRSF